MRTQHAPHRSEAALLFIRVTLWRRVSLLVALCPGLLVALVVLAVIVVTVWRRWSIHMRRIIAVVVTGVVLCVR